MKKRKKNLPGDLWSGGDVQKSKYPKRNQIYGIEISERERENRNALAMYHSPIIVLTRFLL